MASPSLAARAAILGVPYQPNKRPDPLGVVKAIEALDAKAMATSAGAIVRDTKALLDAVVNPPAHQMGWVTGDATAANNGIYENAGSPSAPIWQRRADLPFGLIHMINVGAGTADAIVATSSLPAPVSPGSALFSINIASDNTGPVTINGKRWLTNVGNEFVAGGIKAGGIYLFLDNGDHYRAVTDQDVSALVAAAEDAADRAEIAAGSIIAQTSFKTVAALLADDNNLIGYAGSGASITVDSGDVVTAQGFRYEVAAPDATDNHVETAGGVKLYLANKIAMPSAFGCAPGSGNDDYTQLQKMLDAFRDVYIDGEYASSDGLQLTTGHRIGGCSGSKLTTLGTNKRVLWAYQQSDIVVEGITVEGNLTGNGSTGGTSDGGEGMSFHTCADIVVKNCTFSKVGRTTQLSFVSCLRFDWCDGVKSLHNTFLDDNGGGVVNTGADIQFGYYTRNTEIVGNKSYSNMDQFIAGASVAASEEQTVQHIITHNYGERADGSLNRHGILIPYANMAAKAIVANNILVNFPSTGIYVSAGASDPEDTEGGGIIVTGNIIRWCGGSGVQQAGIYVSGYGGSIVNGNLVEFCGYERTSGNARANASHGAYIVNTSRDITVTGNICRKGSGAGIGVDNTSGGNVMERLLLSGNNLFDNAGGGINVFIAGTSAAIIGLDISGNTITQQANDANGINVTTTGGGLAPINSRISGNNITGKTSATTYAIHSNGSGFKASSIRNNTIVSWARGVSLSNGAIADKEVGHNLVLDSNTFDTCATGIFVGIGVGKFALHFNTMFINCAAETSDANRVLAARNLDGVGRYEIRRSAAPADGAWTAGCMCLITPTAGGFIGSACVSSGSPGTWKSYGAVSA